MGYELKPFEDIRAGFRGTLKALLKDHGVENIEDIGGERSHQALFIKISGEILSSAEKNNETLTAQIFLIGCIIANSYKEDILTALKPDSWTRKGGGGIYKGSTLFDGMMKDVGVTKENMPTLEDIQRFLIIAEEFIDAQVYVDGDSAKGYKYEDKANNLVGHPFSKIKGFHIAPYQRECSKFIQKLNDSIIDRNCAEETKNLAQVEEARKKALEEQLERRRSQQKGKSTGGSWWGGIGIFGGTPEPMTQSEIFKTSTP